MIDRVQSQKFATTLVSRLRNSYVISTKVVVCSFLIKFPFIPQAGCDILEIWAQVAQVRPNYADIGVFISTLKEWNLAFWDDSIMDVGSYSD